MNFIEYPKKISAINHCYQFFSFNKSSLNLLVLALLLSLTLNIIYTNPTNAQQDETFETIKFKDNSGVEHEEYAFRALIKGYPNHVLKMYCANVKLRLYWNVFREEVKDSKRTGKHLRRLARFTRHLYEDIRTVDKPFNAKQLSTIDEWFGVKLSVEDQKELDNATKDDNNPSSNTDNSIRGSAGLKSTSLSIKKTVTKVKGLIKKYTPTIAVGMYTRWRTMWWLMMSCLFAKYYLWDPALDDFIKLQKSMVMYPDFQFVKLQDIDCKPIVFFRHLLDTCKILNPLMNIDFNQLNLDKMWQFKGDSIR